MSDQNQPLPLRLRPKKLDDVIGQDEVVSDLKRILPRPDRPHVYLLSGPYGVGKTSLALIIAAEIGATGLGKREGNGAAFGMDDVRELDEWAHYHSLDDRPKVAVIDEAQALSKRCWQACLKLFEEPPSHTYFVLCTSEPDKVPPAIHTRASHFRLSKVDVSKAVAYANTVVREQGLNIPQEKVMGLALRADGNLRDLLKLLAEKDGAY